MWFQKEEILTALFYDSSVNPRHPNWVTLHPHPGQFFISAKCSLESPECETKLPSKKLGMGYVKTHRFHGNPLYYCGEWGYAYKFNPIKGSTYPRALNWCQIKCLYTCLFHVVIYVNHLICIFMNFNENLIK